MTNNFNKQNSDGNKPGDAKPGQAASGSQQNKGQDNPPESNQRWTQGNNTQRPANPQAQQPSQQKQQTQQPGTDANRQHEPNDRRQANVDSEFGEGGKHADKNPKPPLQTRPAGRDDSDDEETAKKDDLSDGKKR
jgi:hypothetical protein